MSKQVEKTLTRIKLKSLEPLAAQYFLQSQLKKIQFAPKYLSKYGPREFQLKREKQVKPIQTFANQINSKKKIISSLALQKIPEKEEIKISKPDMNPYDIDIQMSPKLQNFRLQPNLINLVESPKNNGRYSVLESPSLKGDKGLALLNFIQNECTQHLSGETTTHHHKSNSFRSNQTTSRMDVYSPTFTALETIQEKEGQKRFKFDYSDNQVKKKLEFSKSKSVRIFNISGVQRLKSQSQDQYYL